MSKTADRDHQYFTLAEANAQLPALTRGFLTVMQLRGRLKALYAKLDEDGYAPEGDRFEIAVPKAPLDVLRARASFKAMVETLREQVAAINALGCTIKDLEIGLVDWWATEGGRDVLLCWRLGEPEVAHWHEPQAGFSGRRPLSELATAATVHP